VAEEVPSEDPLDASAGKKIGADLCVDMLIVGGVCGAPPL
jgi:hypothetical protein